MANQKISDFRRLTATQLAPGDLFPVIDVSEPTTPTGETKSVNANELAQYILNNYAATGSRFIVRYSSSFSNYLGGGANILPTNYVLTNVVVETSGNPIVSIGTSNNIAPPYASITGSWNDNRVYPTQASYDVNYLEVSTYGAVHPLRTVWVQFYSGSDCPCEFSFEGFTR